MEFLTELTVGQLALDATIVLAGLATIVQVAPIKINPWSFLARAIGRAINREVIEKVDNLKNDIDKVKRDAEERAARAARSRILRFGDEIVHGVKHSKEHFDDILEDMNAYDAYCDAHKDFKNNRTKITSKHIRECYQHCMEKRDFL